MARAIGRLKAVTVLKAKKPGLLADGGGLYLRIGPTGAKSWVYRYQLSGRRHDMGIGPYPLISLADAREIVNDVVEGVGDTGVRAGIIGELGCSWPLRPNEAKVLKASAQAQKETGAPITIHPGRHIDAPFEIIDVLDKAGADISRVVMTAPRPAL